ncbi:metallophosphoesterase [Paenactinomyces guangxiensis]|uniref:Metallophosphoesterase n=1 Tax=Paenactinomyces guangxiensis TaxID=1490290 RepID=A0A7W1WST7_9BACL|nr:metallophosphoesterase [Paenactinomyces guangxiensis]MBA4495191.1 metallophosphoesterase [Paenactinomyces guangxiensis]MBH8592275.1 metallophosphoesterase [Paenactinomyces guangxiensis]
MWGLMITVFLFLYSLMCYYIGRRGWTILGKSASRLTRILCLIVFFLLVLPFPAAELGEDVLPGAIVPWLTIWGGYSMIAVLYGFFLLLAIDFIRLIDKWARFIPAAVKEHKKTPPILGAAVVILVLAIVTYGGWNARNPVITEYDVTVNKDAGSLQQLQIAMISDIHYGLIIDVERLNRLIEMMNEIKPDMVVLAGDITDGSLPSGEAGKLAEVLGQIKVPYGTYAVPGNHDRDLRDHDSELMRHLKEAGIHVLKDNSVRIGDSLYLIGRDDPNRRSVPARKELKDLLKGTDSSRPLILLDHQPLDLEQAQANGIDLQLSGHTHRGQIFPANLITGLIYEQDWGLLKKENYHLIISSGFGTWGPPLRIGNHPEVVSITLNFK